MACGLHRPQGFQSRSGVWRRAESANSLIRGADFLARILKRAQQSVDVFLSPIEFSNGRAQMTVYAPHFPRVPQQLGWSVWRACRTRMDRSHPI